MTKILSIPIFLFLLASCAPQFHSVLEKSYPILNYEDKVEIYRIEDSLPDSSELLGTFSVTKGLRMKALETAKLEVRKTGGNLLKIENYSYGEPSTLGASGKIYRVANVQKPPAIDSIAKNKGISYIHVFSFFPGGKIGTGVYLDGNQKIEEKKGRTILEVDGNYSHFLAFGAKNKYPIVVFPKPGETTYVEAVFVQGEVIRILSHYEFIEYDQEMGKYFSEAALYHKFKLFW